MTTKSIETAFTKLVGIDLPIIAAPMFLVSNEAIVIAASNAGGLGAAPSLNWRNPALFEQAVEAIKQGTDRPFAINLIVSKSNPRVDSDLEVVIRHKVPVVITSLGNPQTVIKAVHAYGGKVLCDVTDLKYALKVRDLGADGVIAVSSGAGGHAGSISPLVLIPHLRQHLDIPIVAAGGIATGRQMLAATILGADAVQVGTRFIASTEAAVGDDYKKAILAAAPEDIVMTSRISGTPAAVINTPYIQQAGLDLPWYEKALRKNRLTAKYAKFLRYLSGSRQLRKSGAMTWKSVWSAGQGVGFIHDVLPAGEIMSRLADEYAEARRAFTADKA